MGGAQGGLEPQHSSGRTGLPTFLAGPRIAKHFLFLSPSASHLLCQGHSASGFSEHEAPSNCNFHSSQRQRWVSLALFYR